MKELLLVGAGSCLGGMARYIVSLAFKNLSDYPLATFTANIIGCFIIGVLWTVTNKYSNMSNSISLFLMVGFCGGLLGNNQHYLLHEVHYVVCLFD